MKLASICGLGQFAHCAASVGDASIFGRRWKRTFCEHRCPEGVCPMREAKCVMSDVHLTIDGRPVTVPAGTTIFDAARMHGIAIPTLCHQQNETPVGVCRVCVVEAGGRVLSASCVRPGRRQA